MRGCVGAWAAWREGDEQLNPQSCPRPSGDVTSTVGRGATGGLSTGGAVRGRFPVFAERRMDRVKRAGWPPNPDASRLKGWGEM